MIKIKLDETERLSYLIARISSKADETLNALRRTSFEMQNDEELLSFPQGTLSAELVLCVIENLNRVNETLLSLANAVRSGNEEYIVLERELVSRVSLLAERAGVFLAGFASAATSEKIPVVDCSSGMYRQNEVQELLGESSKPIKAVNIAPVCEILKEEYGADIFDEISEENRGAAK